MIWMWRHFPCQTPTLPVSPFRRAAAASTTGRQMPSTKIWLLGAVSSTATVPSKIQRKASSCLKKGAFSGLKPCFWQNLSHSSHRKKVGFHRGSGITSDPNGTPHMKFWKWNSARTSALKPSCHGWFLAISSANAQARWVHDAPTACLKTGRPKIQYIIVLKIVKKCHKKI